MFVLVLQFLWRKVETLIGKGLDIGTIIKMFAYACASLVPLALPLSILLASIMTMGNFGEKSELTAMKAGGIPLWRVLRPLIIVAFGFSVLSFYFAGYVIPGADLKLKQILADIREKKPAINIRPGEFYTDISSYVIRVGQKDLKTNKMYDLLIYNHSKGNGNTEVIKADSGYMYGADNNQTLIFHLYSGEIYSEDLSNDGKNYFSRPLTRIHFKTQTLRFDVSDFAMQESDTNRYSNNYKVVNISILYHKIDSLKTHNKIYYDKYINTFWRKCNLLYDTNLASKCKENFDFYKDYDTCSLETKRKIEDYALTSCNSIKENYEINSMIKNDDDLYLTRHWIEFFRKFTLSLACIILFFIGAPLGAIIRKGGLGMPVVVSIVAFVIYYIIGTVGESSAKGGTMSPLVAMWLSSIIFLPIGIFLTIKATSDSKLLSLDNWQKIFSKIKSKLNNKQSDNNNQHLETQNTQ